MHQQFFAIAETAPASIIHPKVLVLTGQGGIGKTSLAAKLLELAGVDLPSASIAPTCFYSKIICLKAEDGNSFDEIAEFLMEALDVLPLQPLKIEGQKISRIIQGLQQTQTLLLIDELEAWLHTPLSSNAGHTKDTALGKLLHSLAYSNHQSQIIITSREIPVALANSRYENSEPDPTLVLIEALSGVDTEAGINILHQRKLEDSEEDLRWITERVAGQVFLLTQLAAVAKGKPGYLRSHPELVTQRAEPILKEQLARQSETALALLKRMSILRIGVDIRGLTFLRLYTDAPPDDKSTVESRFLEFAEADIQATQIILDNLVDCSLVEYRYDEKQAELFYDLHRVIKEFLQGEYQEELPALLETVYLFYRASKHIGLSKKLSDLHPILETYSFAYQRGDYQEAFELLRWKLNEPLSRLGYWALLKSLYEQVLPHAEQSEELACRILLGDICIEFGELEQAEQYFQSASSIAQAQEHESDFERCNLGLELISILRQQDSLDEESFSLAAEHKQLHLNSSFSEFLADCNRQSAALAANTHRQMLEFQLQQYQAFIAENGESELANATFIPKIGETLAKLGEAELNAGNKVAGETLRNALQVVTHCGMRKLTALTNYHLARLERLLQNNDVAQAYFTNACNILQDLDEKRELQRIQRMWQQIDD